VTTRRTKRTGATIASAIGAAVLALVALAGSSRSERADATTTTTWSSTNAPTRDPFADFDLSGPPIDWSLPTSSAIVEPEGFVGSAACARCHTDVAHSWDAHGMAHTGLRRIEGRTKALDAIFDGKQIVRHAASGFSYRAMHDDEGYFVEETIVAPDGEPLHVRRERVTLSFAAGVLGTAFGFERGGRMHRVPIDFYPQAGVWAIDPGFVGNGRFSRTFGLECLGCHGEVGRHVAGNDAIVAAPLSNGVGCEQCHGPGARHVESTKGDDVVDPSKLSIARQIELCAGCHVEGVASTHFGDQRLAWVEATPSGDRFDLTSAADRLVRSRCFVGSKDAKTTMVCTTCHDVHNGTNINARSKANGACVGCHAHSTAPATKCPRGDDCVQCHMARDTPSDFRSLVPGVPLEITDHWIRARLPPTRPIDAMTLPTPPRAIVAWPALIGQTIVPDATFVANEGLALITAHLDDEGVAKLRSIAHAPPPMPALYAFLGDVYEEERMNARTIAARAMEVRLSMNDVAVLTKYAQAIVEVDANEAERALRRALEVFPSDATASNELGGILFRRGDVAAAVPWFERAANNGNDSVEAHVVLAVIAQEKGDVASATMHLEAARSEAPRDRWILTRLATLYRATGYTTALADVDHALRFVPADPRPLDLVRSTRWLSPADR
jgi:hypothetical protein